MSTISTPQIPNKIILQNNEFDAVAYLSRRYASLCQTAVVDDDYPEMRHYYESAVRKLIEAFKANGRII